MGRNPGTKAIGSAFGVAATPRDMFAILTKSTRTNHK